jgi:hypothetical protein
MKFIKIFLSQWAHYMIFAWLMCTPSAVYAQITSFNAQQPYILSLDSTLTNVLYFQNPLRTYSTNVTLTAATSLTICFSPPFADTNYIVTAPNDLTGSMVTARTTTNFTLGFTSATLNGQMIEGSCIHQWDNATVAVVTNPVVPIDTNTTAATVTNGPGEIVPDVAWWKMNEGSGSVAGDSTGNGNAGTLANCAWGGGFLAFNGTNSYVDCGHGSSLNIAGQFTITCWFKVAALPAAGQSGWFIAKDAGTGSSFDFGLGNFSPDNHLILQVNGSLEGFSGSSSTVDGLWHFAAVVSNGSGEQYYLDGVTDSGAGGSISPNITSSDLTIGGCLVAGNNAFFNGSLDDVRIYGRPLSAAEVATLYANGPK